MLQFYDVETNKSLRCLSEAGVETEVMLDDIDSAVEALSNKGVTFEHYDFAEMKTDEKGIARQGERGIAWFKDPAGNFISIIQEK